MSFRGIFRFDQIPLNRPVIKSNQIGLIYSKGHVIIEKSFLDRESSNTFLFFHSKDGKQPFQNTLDYKDVHYGNVLKPSITSIENIDHFNDLICDKNFPISTAILYNEQNGHLEIARSAFGLVPLFYIHVPNQFTAFAADIKSLLQIQEIKSIISVNSVTIWNYLSLTKEGVPYGANTFFNHISSIIPGQKIVFTSNELKNEIYMRYNPTKWDHINSLNEYGEEFKHLFSKSVQRCLDGKNIIGAQLSGGLDSSSVSTVARLIKPDSEFHVFYSETHSPMANEKHFSLEVAEKINASHHIIIPSLNDIDTLIRHTELYGQPEQMALSPTFQGGLIQNAKESNCDILLTGHDGDSVVGKGNDFLNSLFRAENWLRLKIELSNLARNNNFYSLDQNWNGLTDITKEQLIYQNFFYKRLIYCLKNLSFKQYIKLIAVADNVFNIKRTKSVGAGIEALIYILQKKISSSPNSIQKYTYQEIREGNPSISETTRFIDDKNAEFTDSILFTQSIRINEEYFALARHYDFSIRHPFYDPNLYELCLAVPQLIKFGNGIGRAHLRKAMEGILPESVRTRADKAIFNTYAKDSALRLFDQGRDFLVDSSPVWDHVDKKKFFLAVRILQRKEQHSGTQHLMTFFVNRTIFLAVWLYSLK
ncbi:asparagine synthase-related protein [Dyadobacter frigoris]|uniref:asparagine synthase (glutamine-hydrolyzing) n=1 Tax=Dyadobacter frigoris TaxID=2576211 RepID=A0A4U6DFR8_9BACT|nr:asparagine synthetase B family protein [Dyadobacter frigoris]TKT93434.1 hypothetical protein FDK13_06175 [Dyadobacter frigoris]GLU55843.1 hypothetical protein Dfri01_53040 [Dyadobacter frigoris]